MYGNAILKMAERDGWTVIPIEANSCSADRWTGPRRNDRCGAWFDWGMAQVRKIRPTAVLLGTSYGAADANKVNAIVGSMQTAVNSLKGLSKDVVILSDTPQNPSGKAPADCLLAPNATLAACSVTRSGSAGQADSTLAALAQTNDSAFIDTSGWFCDRLECPMVVGNRIVYHDNTGHVTAVYADRLADPFRSAFRSAITAK
jgi:hypothetical protein